MAFTGVAVVKQVTDKEIRITGLSLAAGATGTIGLAENSGAPGVKLPAGFKPRPYHNGEAVLVTLQDSVDVQAKPVAAGVATITPVSVGKAGTTELDFLATLTNNDGAAATPGLEIYIRFHD